jgi:hypothetical protein
MSHDPKALPNNLKEHLTRGLLSGFAGKSDFAELERGGFRFKTSDVSDENFKYHDEWLDAKVGGGQELLQVGDLGFTRLYAGGVLNDAQLSVLGISESDISAFLKNALVALEQNTRLEKECTFSVDNWDYRYEVVATAPIIGMIVGKESISFKQREVFVHYFLLCPVEH